MSSMKKMMKQENWSPFSCRLHRSVLSQASQTTSKILLLFISVPFKEQIPKKTYWGTWQVIFPTHTPSPDVDYLQSLHLEKMRCSIFTFFLLFVTLFVYGIFPHLSLPDWRVLIYLVIPCIFIMQYNYLKFIIEMVAYVRTACLIATHGETVLQFLGVSCSPE